MAAVGFHNGGPQPLLYQPENPGVADAQDQHFHQPVMLDVVKEPADVRCFKDFPNGTSHDCVFHGPEGIVGTAARTEPVGAVPEIRFVNRGQQPTDGRLQQAVLHFGNSPSRLHHSPIPLGDR